MNRKYVFILLISVGVFIFSANKIYKKVENYLYTAHYPKGSNTVSSKSKDFSSKDLLESQKISNTSGLESQEKKEDSLSEGVQTSTRTHPTPKNYKIVLRYENKKAKSVKLKLSGSSYSWKEREMKRRSPGVWEDEITVIDKGVYRYYFIVDGKKVLDPKANRSSDGKFSIVEVR